MKVFECLNNERPTNTFLTIVRNIHQGDSLSQICDDEGKEFESETARNTYIANYYGKLYNRDESETVEEGCIETFLGDNIVNSELVRNSKLTDQEKNLLDSPLTLEELDSSLGKANFKSAPGIDGYSNKAISKCWQYIRVPLLNYSNYCFNTGTLTNSFRSATIRLIPKKGDKKKIQNWRPISLLSNVYKVISRTINIRLKKITARVFSRAQKGFTSNRYTQEVLINILETMAHCRSTGEKGVIVAADMAKAFDCLSHRFSDLALRFFGFGDNIRRWIQLISTYRQA